MGFNYSLEKKKFDKEWARKSAWYRAEGMSEDAIQAMYGFDWNAFNAERAFLNHTQERPDEFFDNEGDDCSTLFQKFESLSTSFSIEDFSGRYAWVDAVERSRLATVLKKLRRDDLELLTLLLLENYTVVEIARKQGIAHSTISRKWSRLRKYLKNFVADSTD